KGLHPGDPRSLAGRADARRRRHEPRQRRPVPRGGLRRGRPRRLARRSPARGARRIRRDHAPGPSIRRSRASVRESRGRPGRSVKRSPLSSGVIALALALCLGPRVGRAGTEEFSPFDVEQQEEDDESLLDHLLTRAPRAWRAEWERAPQAFRTQQGCLTSGQWLIHSDLKLETALGSRARLGVKLRQYEDDAANFNYLDLTFRFPTRFGTVGALFRPLYDKSRQDFGVTWEAGADTS